MRSPRPPSNVVRLFPRAHASPGAPSLRPGRGRQAPSDAELVSRVVLGDTASHRVLFDRYYARVSAFVRRRIRDERLCEEIVAEVIFEVWRNAGAFHGASEVHSWIFGIAHFKALSARLRQRETRDEGGER